MTIQETKSFNMLKTKGFFFVLCGNIQQRLQKYLVLKKSQEHSCTLNKNQNLSSF